MFILSGFGGTSNNAVQSGGTTSDPTPLTCDYQSVDFHLDRTKALLKKGYSKKRWEDKTPLKDNEKTAIKDHKFCLNKAKHRAEVEEQRDKFKQKFEEYRLQRLVTPFKGPNGTYWAIPYQVVWCETQATNVSPHGYYALVDWNNPTWSGSSFAPNASAATFLEQSIVAGEMYAMFGLSPWNPSRHCWG